MDEIRTASRAAFRELLDTLAEVDRRWASAEWNLMGEADVTGAHRALMHLLEGGLVTFFESDPARPRFQRIVTPTRKLTGDNADAIYHDAAVSPEYTYVVRGRMDGAVYVSITVECDTEDGGMATRTAGVLNESGFDVDAEGRFAIHLGGPPPPPDDASVARAIRRVATFVRARTLGQPPMANTTPPPFVSLVPNQFPPPVSPGNFGLAAADATYSMAPFVLGPDDALVMTGRWPTCRCANVSLWNRFLQTLDYANRPVSRNRAQTTLEPDGSFRMILAHRDPGHPNWLDTEGRTYGVVFWRFMLAEGPVATPQAEVVPFADVARR
jgi:hypothetical protein